MPSNTIDISTAAERLGTTERHVRRMCTSGKLAGAAKAGRRWRIPTTAHARLMAAPSEPAHGRVDLDRLNPRKRDDAMRKLALVKECEAYCAAAVRNGFFQSQAIEAFAARVDIGKRTLQRWMADFRKDGIGGLIDTRGGGNADGEIFSNDAWQYFLSLYLDLKQPTAKQCYDITYFINNREERGWSIPSIQYVYKYIDRHLPMPVAVLHREGTDAYEAKCSPYIIKDIDSIDPGAIWVGDHHQFNCWVRHRGEWIRPWLTAWADMRTRTMMGWYVTAAPNQVTILQAFRHGINRFGPPESVKIDNGKDYDSEMWTGVTKKQRRVLKKGYIDETNVAGLYALMNIGVSFAIPYNAKAKPVERYFDTLDKQFVKTIPTYCGKDAARKPDDLNDYLKSQRAIDESLTLDEFAEMVGQYIEIYNNSAHTGDGMDGRSPMQVLSGRSSRRMISTDALDLLCQVWTRTQKIGKNGVKVNKLWYGQYDTQLMMAQGRGVRCAYDPDDVSRVRVYDAHTYQYITTAEQATMVAYGTGVAEEDVREGMRQSTRARRVVRQYKPAAKVAQTDLTHLALAAAKERTQPAPTETTTSLRPVATPMDGQTKEVKRCERVRTVRKAAGAEGVRQVLDFDFDDEPIQRPRESLEFEIADVPQRETVNLRIFNE